MNDKYLRSLSPLSRRRLLSALIASPLAAALGRDGILKVTDMLVGSETAYAAPGIVKYFIEINLRDQWDFMHFMVPPGLATANNLIRAQSGENGEERLCGLYQDPKTLTKAGNNFYLTDDSKDMVPHLNQVAALETIELCIGKIHGHEAANAMRSPGRDYTKENGKTAMWLADDGTQQDPGGDEFLYSSSPTPAMAHLNLIRQSNANARAVALKFLGRGDKKHTVYHHAASLSDNGFLRIQSREQLAQTFEASAPKDALTRDEVKAMSDMIRKLDSSFLKRMKYTSDAQKRHNEHQESFVARILDGNKPLSMTLTEEEKDYWSKGVPPESSSAPRMHLWEQSAITAKLLAANAASTVAMEFSFDDLHGARPKREVVNQGKIIGMVLSRLIADLKSKNLWDDTLIMLNTVDGGRSPAVDSAGDSGKNSLILAGGMIQGGYYGDIRVAGTNGNVHSYSYHTPDLKTGRTLDRGATDNGNRVAGVAAYRTILTAMGAPVSFLKSFPDVGDGDNLNFMLKTS